MKRFSRGFAVRALLFWLVLIALWVASIVYVYGFGAIAGRVAPQMTEKSMRRSAPLLRWVAQLSAGEGEQPCATNTINCGFNDASDRTERGCEDFAGQPARVAVLFAFGQSNSANAGRDRHIAGKAVSNFNPLSGKCYHAEDPLLGTDGDGGSVWTRLGDQLIDSGAYEKVLVVPFGIGGTEIARWTQGGDLHPRVEQAATKLNEQNIIPTHVLWHQGEWDAAEGTSSHTYSKQFGSMLEALRSYGVDAPVYPAVATHCNLFELDLGPEKIARHEAIREAQQSLPSLFKGVRPGPDTDQIQGSYNRHDNCHFTHMGMQAHAALWHAALLAGGS